MANDKTPHPNQPIVDVEGVNRFKANPIVRYLLDKGPFDLNHLAIQEEFEADDHAHFAQLIGYSVSGWGGLSYVSTARYESVPELGEDGRTYQEGFAEGMAHAVSLLESHIRGDYDG